VDLQDGQDIFMKLLIKKKSGKYTEINKAIREDGKDNFE